MNELTEYQKEFREYAIGVMEDMGKFLDDKIHNIYEKYKDAPDSDEKREVMEMYYNWVEKHNK